MRGGITVHKDQQLTASSSDQGIPWQTLNVFHPRLTSIFVNFIRKELQPILTFGHMLKILYMYVE